MNPLPQVSTFSATPENVVFDQNATLSTGQAEIQELGGATPENISVTSLEISVKETKEASTEVYTQALGNVDDKNNACGDKGKHIRDISITRADNTATAGQSNIECDSLTFPVITKEGNLAKVEDISLPESEMSSKIIESTTAISDEKAETVADDSAVHSIPSGDVLNSEGKTSDSLSDVSQASTSVTKGKKLVEDESLVGKDNPEALVVSGQDSGEKLTSVADIISKFQKCERCSEASKETEAPVTSSQKTPLEMRGNEKAEGVLSKEADVETDEMKESISLKDLEQSFITALNMPTVSANEALKSEIVRKTSTGKAPSMKFIETFNSKQECTTSESSGIENKIDAGATFGGELKTNVPILKDKKSVVQSIGTNTVDNKGSIASTSVSKSESDDNKSEERKAFFYLSTSDLPSGLNYESSQDLDAVRYRSVANSRFRGSRQSNRGGSSFLCSKSVHGVIFLASFIVALFGYILYNLANKGKVPDIFESVGLTTAIIAAIIGVISFVCFSILGAFPVLPTAGYERIGDPESSGSRSRIENPRLAVHDESWSSDMERAFRRQNGMASAHPSEIVLTKLNNRQILIEKTEKLKNEVTGVLDSFIEEVSQMDPVED